MLKIVGIALLVRIGGYVLGVVVGIALVQLFSDNRFDKQMETVMTGVFVVGPLGAVLGFLAALIVQFVRRA